MQSRTTFGSDPLDVSLRLLGAKRKEVRAVAGWTAERRMLNAECRSLKAYRLSLIAYRPARDSAPGHVAALIRAR